MEHYYSEKQHSELHLHKLSVRMYGFETEFSTGSGTFSIKRLDLGSEVLLKYCIIAGNEKVHDLGCGWGAIGILLKKRFPEIEISFSDINERAVMLTKKNCLMNCIDADIYISDGFAKIKDNFDAVLLNPPMAAGQVICFRLIEESFSHLNTDGNLQIVARTQKGGRALMAHMEKVFGNAELLKKKSGFGVYISYKRKD